MTDELKPCPFCGNPPLPCHDSSYGYWQIACGDTNVCGVWPNVQLATRAEAIKVWNTRPSHATASELLADLGDE